MKKSASVTVIMTLLLTGVLLSVSGCKKPVPVPPPAARIETPPPPPPVLPTPTLQLRATPATIASGQSSTLSWSTTDATSVSIDGGVGTVEPSGSRTVSPAESTTYRARANGPGGTASAEARVTVTAPPPAVAPDRPLTDSEFFNTNVHDIYFDYDKYEIRQDAARTLAGNARALAERPRLQFTVEGHCDERGSEKYNLALGDKRANSAKQYLTSQGVNPDRVDTVSYGEEKPQCSNHSEECWQKNRRAHFVLR